MKFHHLPAGGAPPLGRAMPAAEMNPEELLEKAGAGAVGVLGQERRMGRRGAGTGGAGSKSEGRTTKANAK